MINQQHMALVVDDELDDLEVVRHALASAGYNVKTAMDGKTAIEIFRAHAEEIDILVTDVAMSPMTGCDLAAQLVQLKWNCDSYQWSTGTGDGIGRRHSRREAHRHLVESG